MNVDNVRLPDYVERGFKGGPKFDTSILTSVSGIEQRVINRTASRAEYTLSYGARSDPTVWQAVLTFGFTQRGQGYGFLFKDWIDYTATAQLLGVGDTVRTDFQLVKVYNSGVRSYSRTITQPDSTTLKVYLNGVLQGTGYTLQSLGIVRFSSPPGSGVAITADFNFFVPVRFASDFLEAELPIAGVAAFTNVTVIEILPGSP